MPAPAALSDPNTNHEKHEHNEPEHHEPKPHSSEHHEQDPQPPPTQPPPAYPLPPEPEHHEQAAPRGQPLEPEHHEHTEPEHHESEHYAPEHYEKDSQPLLMPPPPAQPQSPARAAGRALGGASSPPAPQARVGVEQVASPLAAPRCCDGDACVGPWRAAFGRCAHCRLLEATIVDTEVGDLEPTVADPDTDDDDLYDNLYDLAGSPMPPSAEEIHARFCIARSCEPRPRGRRSSFLG